MGKGDGIMETLCCYWSSKRANKNGDILTYVVIADFTKKQYKTSSGYAIPQGANVIEVASKFDLNKLEQALVRMSMTKIK